MKCGIEAVYYCSQAQTSKLKYTMFKKEVIIISAEEKNEIGTMCRSVLSQISMPDILKITFFYQAANDKEYLEKI